MSSFSYFPCLLPSPPTYLPSPPTYLPSPPTYLPSPPTYLPSPQIYLPSPLSPPNISSFPSFPPQIYLPSPLSPPNISSLPSFFPPTMSPFPSVSQHVVLPLPSLLCLPNSDFCIFCKEWSPWGQALNCIWWLGSGELLRPRVVDIYPCLPLGRI